jgi:hypothetical protein
MNAKFVPFGDIGVDGGAAKNTKNNLRIGTPIFVRRDILRYSHGYGVKAARSGRS